MIPARLLVVVEAKYQSAYPLVRVQLPENLGCVKEMLVLENPVKCKCHVCSQTGCSTYFFAFHASSGKFRIKASQYPLIKNMKVRNAWTAASGMM